MLVTTKRMAFRGRPERTDVKLIGRINANTAPLVFSYKEGMYEHITQRPENGKVGFNDDKDDIINVVVKEQEFHAVSPLTGAVGAGYPSLDKMKAAWVGPFLGYVVVDFEDGKPVNVTFKKWENKS